MGEVVADMSMSLDGFVAGPNDDVDNPLGDGGMQLHEWLFELASWRRPHGRSGGITGPVDDFFAESMANVGACVLGRRMYDLGAPSWGENPPFHVPVFVPTHEAKEPRLLEGGTVFTFVTEGFAAALERAGMVTGPDADVALGGANVIQQAIAGRVLDEIRVHLVPIFLGGGVRLFDGLGPEAGRFECTRVVESPQVTHLVLRAIPA